MPMSLDGKLSEAIILPVEEKTILAEVKRRRDELRSGVIKPINGEEALAKVKASI